LPSARIRSAESGLQRALLTAVVVLTMIVSFLLSVVQRFAEDRELLRLRLRSRRPFMPTA
jgi:hypothetical protein